jgi:hypothetical protein
MLTIVPSAARTWTIAQLLNQCGCSLTPLGESRLDARGLTVEFTTHGVAAICVSSAIIKLNKNNTTS